MLLTAEIREPVLGCLRNGLRRPHGRLSPIVYGFEHILHAILNGNARLPVEFLLDPPGIRESAVRFARSFWNMHRRRRLEELCEVVYRHRVVTADIETQPYLV